MADPVAAKSGFLCMYMSNHPDTLVSYVKYWGKVSESVAKAQMKAIDSKGMTLTYTVHGQAASKEVRVAFELPLAGYEDVKPRLLSMKADAEEALGMTKAPQISTFKVPSGALPSVLLQSFLLYNTVPNFVAPSPFFALAGTLREALGPHAVKAAWAFMIFAHALESVYTYTLCRRYRTGFVVGTQYVLWTLLFGYSGWTDLRRRVQTARIDSIMKGR